MTLVAHYKMDDNAANTMVVDSMGFSNGTAQRNTSLLSVDGKINKALKFDGTSDYIDTNSNFSSVLNKDFSFALWCKPNDGVSIYNRDICGIQQNDDIAGLFENIATITHRSSGRLQITYGMDVDSNSVSITSESVFTDGLQDWHFVVATVKQVGAKVELNLYLDGESIGQETSSMDMSMMDWEATDNIFVGAKNKSSALDPRYVFDGSIDNFMVFDHVLTEEDISFLWNDGDGTEDWPPPVTGGFTLSITGTVEITANVEWACPPGESITVKIPEGVTLLHYAGDTVGAKGYLRKVEFK